ncbi:MAG UNVERIFIED_CONTAM: hypothetical protein LVR29_06800 [Microcystis novacekii LVE1205-3]|jgi:hypothetical protein
MANLLSPNYREFRGNADSLVWPYDYGIDMEESEAEESVQEYPSLKWSLESQSH